MECCIGIGELDKNLYVLLLAVIFKIVNDFIYGINYPQNIKKKSLNIYDSILKDNLILQSILKYFSISILSFVFYKYGNSNIGNISQNINDYNLNDREKTGRRISQSKKFFLIHNKLGPDNTKYIVQILFVGFLLVFSELILQFFISVAPSNTDFWTFELLFTVFFIRKIFKNKILYIHQLFSMFFIIILCSTVKFLLFLKGNNYLFNSNLLFIPGYLLIVLIRSYVYTKIKWLIDIRYISISKMLFIYGLFGFFISLII